jgi:hypothetical protein
MSGSTIAVLAICIPLAALSFYLDRQNVARNLKASWIAIRHIPKGCACAVRGDIDGAFKGIADSINYLNGGEPE